MQQKRQKLLDWNKATHKTFEDRAFNARIICSANEEELDMMLHAVENNLV